MKSLRDGSRLPCFHSFSPFIWHVLRPRLSVMRAIGARRPGLVLGLPIAEKRCLLLRQEPPFMLLGGGVGPFIDGCQSGRLFRMLAQGAWLDAVLSGKVNES